MVACRNLIHSLTLHTGITLKEAQDTAISDAEEFFSSKVFAAKLKESEASFKLQMAMIGRLDAMLKMRNRKR